MAEKQLHIGSHALSPVRPGMFRIEKKGKMRVGVELVASPEILQNLGEDSTLEQACNVATLPGVLDPVLAMPDMHQGYGFPIGGVAAFDAKAGVVSPGGVGYDINCGVRLLTSTLTRDAVGDARELSALIETLFDRIPTGVGGQRKDIKISAKNLERILDEGAKWAHRQGYCEDGDIERIEEGGHLPGANPDKVSDRAKERGQPQLGTLGSGNHFVEIQYVDKVLNAPVAKEFGLFENQLVVTVHTGSRGLGYQVCDDYLQQSFEASRHYGIELASRELASAPIASEVGQNYLQAMQAAANFAFVNRQVIAYFVREIFAEKFGGAKLKLLYDVCHNIAKFEKLPVEGKLRTVCIHRKGATRAYPGQPVIVPGDMGRYSFVMVGKQESLQHSFGSSCHGAGRELSRREAKKKAHGRHILQELQKEGIVVRASGRHTVIEEMPEAYKDVASVVSAVQKAQIAEPVVRLRPVGGIKG